jgi:hypothetical protein
MEEGIFFFFNEARALVEVKYAVKKWPGPAQFGKALGEIVGERFRPRSGDIRVVLSIIAGIKET